MSPGGSYRPLSIPPHKTFANNVGMPVWRRLGEQLSLSHDNPHRNSPSHFFAFRRARRPISCFFLLQLLLCFVLLFSLLKKYNVCVGRGKEGKKTHTHTHMPTDTHTHAQKTCKGMSTRGTNQITKTIVHIHTIGCSPITPFDQLFRIRHDAILSSFS